MAPDAVVEALATFEGLPHRMRDAGVVAKVRYVDDSKSTNPHAAQHALAACLKSYADHRVFWLVGGRLKGELRPLFAELLAFVKTQPLIDSGYFFGESGEALAAHFEGCLPSRPFEKLAQAFHAARANAKEAVGAGSCAVVLLSPACSSHDHFASYAARGEHFSALVAASETAGEAS